MGSEAVTETRAIIDAAAKFLAPADYGDTG